MNPIVPSAFGWLSGNTPLPEERRRDRQVEALAESDQRLGGAVARHARPGQHDRVPRLGEHLRRPQAPGRSSGAGSTGVFTGSAGASVVRSATSSGSDQEGRAGRLGRGLLEGLAHHLGGRDADRHHVAPLRDRPEERHEVDELVRLLVDAVEARLGGERDERMAVELGVRDAEHQVDRTRAEGREAHPGAAGERPVGVGHERRPALVARGDEPDRGIGEGVDRVEVLLARKPEHQLDALVLEALDDRARDGAAGEGHGGSVTDDRGDGCRRASGSRARADA